MKEFEDSNLKLGKVHLTYRELMKLNKNIDSLMTDYFTCRVEILEAYGELDYIKRAIERLGIEYKIREMVEIIKTEEDLIERIKEIEFNIKNNDPLEYYDEQFEV